MNQKKDDMDRLIRDELKKEAAELQNEYEASGAKKMPENLKTDIHERLKKQIENYELENLYAKLPEQDRKAMELGKKIMEQEEKKEAKESSVRTVRYRKKLWKMYGSVAAVIVLVLAIGVTSFGGADRIIAIMKSVVGDREIVQVDSDEDNMVIAAENEEEAYEEVKDVFGIEPVRVIGSYDLFFESAEIDEAMQLAELLYKYKGENLIYIINATYATTSWGLDVEDEVTEQYNMEIKGKMVEIKEYRTPKTHTKRYSARFSHKKVEYFLMGTMNKQEFIKIVKDLYFFD